MTIQYDTLTSFRNRITQYRIGVAFRDVYTRVALYIYTVTDFLTQSDVYTTNILYKSLPIERPIDMGG